MLRDPVLSAPPFGTLQEPGSCPVEEAVRLQPKEKKLWRTGGIVGAQAQTQASTSLVARCVWEPRLAVVSP